MRGDMSRQTPEIINPTPEEDAAINAGVAADPVTLSSISEMEPRPADPLELRPASGRFRLRRWVAYRYRSADPSAVATEEFPVDAGQAALAITFTASTSAVRAPAWRWGFEMRLGDGGGGQAEGGNAGAITGAGGQVAGTGQGVPPAGP